MKDVAASKQSMLESSKLKTLEGERVAFLVENGYDYVGRHTIIVPAISEGPL